MRAYCFTANDYREFRVDLEKFFGTGTGAVLLKKVPTTLLKDCVVL
jgi:hypothetical protein